MKKCLIYKLVLLSYFGTVNSSGIGEIELEQDDYDCVDDYNICKFNEDLKKENERLSSEISRLKSIIEKLNKEYSSMKKLNYSLVEEIKSLRIKRTKDEGIFNS